MTMDKQQAARDICPECGELGHTSCYNAGYQAAQAALMPVLVEARDSIIEARRNIDAVDNALADAFMWDALASLNTIIGEK